MPRPQRSYLSPTPASVLQPAQQLSGHSAVVRALAWSHDSALLLSGGKDRTLIVWRPAESEQPLQRQRFPGWVASLAWGAHEWVAVGCSDGHVYRWSPAGTERADRPLIDQQQLVSDLAWLDADHLISAGAGTAAIWHTASGTCVHTLAGHRGRVTSIAVSAALGLIASAAEEETVRVWESASGALLHTFKPHEWYISSVAWHPTRPWLTSGSLDEMIHIIDYPTGALVQRCGHVPDWVRCLDWHPSGDWLVCGCKNGALWLWRREGAQLVCHGTLQAHQRNILALQWSHDGRWLASASEDRSVRVWAFAPD